MAAYWGIAAHSAYYMFSLYKYLSVFLVFFPTSRFMEWEFLSDRTISRSLPTCTFLYVGYTSPNVVNSNARFALIRNKLVKYRCDFRIFVIGSKHLEQMLCVINTESDLI